MHKNVVKYPETKCSRNNGRSTKVKNARYRKKLNNSTTLKERYFHMYERLLSQEDDDIDKAVCGLDKYINV